MTGSRLRTMTYSNPEGYERFMGRWSARLAQLLDQQTGADLARELRSMILKVRSDGSFALPARAWAVAGTADR
jgi:hypothetical protein